VKTGFDSLADMPKKVLKACFLLTLLLSVLTAGCYESLPGLPDAGDASDAQNGYDLEEQASCAGCNGPVCIASLSGKILFEDGTPYKGVVSFCIVQGCLTSNTDDQGIFKRKIPDGCRAFDFTKEEGIHFSLLSIPEGGWTQYSVSFKPAQDEVSDLGVDDFDLDLGTHYYYRLPGDKVQYTPENGADISNISGLSFSVPPGDLGEEQQQVRVLRFPLKGEKPAFVPSNLDLDVLYFVAPYYVKSKSGIVFHIDASALGWQQGDKGTIYMLGDFANLNHLECGGNQVEVGTMAPCGEATFENGEIKTDPLPLLGWFGVKKTG